MQDFKLKLLNRSLLYFILNALLIGCSNNHKDLEISVPLEIPSSKIEFIETLSADLKIYIEQNVYSIYKCRTDYWSLQPFRMFWQSAFVADEARRDGWESAFQNSPLSYKGLDEFINLQIDNFNKTTTNDKLNHVHLQAYSGSSIINEQTYDLIKNNEFDNWISNVWLVTLWGMFLFCIVLLAGQFQIYVTLVAGCTLEALISLIINFFSEDISLTIINNITSNYLHYINSQNIMAQMFI